MLDRTDADAERWLDLDVKLAYQERLIHELDALVQESGARLDKAEREFAQLKAAMPPPVPLGAANEPPPHYDDRDLTTASAVAVRRTTASVRTRLPAVAPARRVG